MSLDLQRIRALCFDIDGTLSDTDDQYVAKLAAWLRPLRFLLNGKNAKQAARWIVTSLETPGNWLLCLADQLGIDDELARTANSLERRESRITTRHHVLIPGVRETLTVLQPHYPMSIVSVRGQLSTVRFLEAFDLLNFFPVIASAQTCTHAKPYPDQIFWAAAQMGVSPQNCLMIGDTVPDIQAGRAAGAQTVGVLCGFGTADELLRAGADLVIDSTTELADELENQIPT